MSTEKPNAGNWDLSVLKESEVKDVLVNRTVCLGTVPNTTWEKSRRYSGNLGLRNEQNKRVGNQTITVKLTNRI